MNFPSTCTVCDVTFEILQSLNIKGKLRLLLARLSGTDPDDEELEEVEELERLTSLADQSLWTRLKKFVLDLVERVGFFGILVCASVSTYQLLLEFLFGVQCCLMYFSFQLINFPNFWRGVVSPVVWASDFATEGGDFESGIFYSHASSLHPGLSVGTSDLLGGPN